MTDKVQKIKEWISKEQDGLMDANGNFEYPEHEGAYHILCNLDAYIDSLQEEHVNEDLEKAAKEHSFIDGADDIEEYARYNIKKYNSFKYGAKWQEKKTINEVCKWLDNHTMLSEKWYIEDLKKHLEDKL